MGQSELQPVTLENLEYGQMMAKGNQLFAQLVADVIKRPGVKTAREMTIKVKVVPEVIEDTDINIPKFVWDAGIKIPGIKGRVVSGKVVGDEIHININDPYGKRPDQPTLFDGHTPIIDMGGKA